MNLLDRVLGLKDDVYQNFSKNLIPTKYTIIGVRTPSVKALVKSLTADEMEEVFNSTPTTYEEVVIRGMLLGRIKDVDKLVYEIDRLLELIDNWACCDATVACLKQIKKNKERFFALCTKWLESDKEFTKRFAVVIFLDYYADDEWADRVLKLIVSGKNYSSEFGYYYGMAVAWLLSVYLVKCYDITLPYIKAKIFDKFIQNKAISKAHDSFRIDEETKKGLKEFRYDK